MDNISFLTSNPSLSVAKDEKKLIQGDASSGGGNFSDIFKNALDMAEGTEAQDKSSVLSLLTGEADDISGVLIDSQKAQLALSLTIQLRNKMLESYNEVMNMQM